MTITKKPVILIVDDEQDARATLLDYLGKRFSCELKEAKDGEEAVNFAKTTHCDIILLDIKMPRKSGMTVIKEVKEVSPSTGIIVISAYVSDDVCDEATRLGAHDYIVKPVDLKAVEIKVGQMLKSKIE